MFNEDPLTALSTIGSCGADSGSAVASVKGNVRSATGGSVASHRHRE